jgi:DNA (cytosine-5)-methyltransferase 1
VRLLDLFCGAGGAAMGYKRAGFDDIVGVDIKPQPNYPFEFVQGDALEYVTQHGHEFDVIHASPPCQAYSMMQNIHKNTSEHPDLIEPTRESLIKTGMPYVIENVYKAPLKASMMLCGTMFGLRIIRHRWFESNVDIFKLMSPCNHSDVYDPWHGLGRTADKYRDAMDIDWMPQSSLSEAIPPAYTEFIGRHIIDVNEP